MPDADVAGLLQTLSRETRGRLRALVAHVGEGPPAVVGVLSWLLLSDGWHALETHHRAGRHPARPAARRRGERPRHRAGSPVRGGVRMTPYDDPRGRPGSGRGRRPGRQVRPDAAARRPVRLLRPGDARTVQARLRDPPRRGRRRVERALEGDLRRGRRRHPRGDHRQARAADPVDRARRRRAGRPRHGAHLPLDRRAAGGGVPDARHDRRPRHRLPRARRRARRRHRVGRPDRDRRAGPRRHRRLPQRARRGQPRPDGPRHQRWRRPGRGHAAAVTAHVRAAGRRPRPDGGGRRLARDRRRPVRGRHHRGGARRRWPGRGSGAGATSHRLRSSPSARRGRSRS